MKDPLPKENASPHHPPPGPKGHSFGCVVADTTRQNVLLRKPAGEHDGYVWTFAKGKRDPNGETPEQAAIREAAEELGWHVRLLAPLPRWFAGPKWANFFWLAEAVELTGKPLHWETASIRWCTWDEAVALLSETRVPHRRDRDLEILQAARELAGRQVHTAN